MSATDAATYPKGATLLETINNPSKGAKISPSTQTTTTPLTPVVTAVLNGDVITVDVTVCIDAKVSVESLLIYQNLNNATPEFYVVYNYQEEVPTSLYPYKFKFDIQTNGVSMPAIMTFLWDSDPIGSRGTETQVQG
jgi:hypothetical protein